MTSTLQDSAVRIHPSAIVEEGVALGGGTAIWDAVHIRSGAIIGANCIIGEKTYIAGDTVIGNLVKINAFVYICAGVTIEAGAMISAATVFTNDRFPRATNPDVSVLRSSDVDEHTKTTLVKEGATIGANCTIGNDLIIGRFAMVGMGTTVTRSIADYALVFGNPARQTGWVCRCGEPIHRFEPARSFKHTAADAEPGTAIRLDCLCCHRWYEMCGASLREVSETAT